VGSAELFHAAGQPFSPSGVEAVRVFTWEGAGERKVASSAFIAVGKPPRSAFDRLCQVGSQ
jgi:hypothetical protein